MLHQSYLYLDLLPETLPHTRPHANQNTSRIAAYLMLYMLGASSHTLKVVLYITSVGTSSSVDALRKQPASTTASSVESYDV